MWQSQSSRLDGRVGDEAVVGVDGHAEAEVHVELERVAREIADGARLHVRRGAALERDAVVVDVVEEVAVLAQAAAVADAVRAADVDRLGDRLGAVGLARVDGHVDVVVANELERRLVVLGRVVVLGAREVEADDAAALVRDRELRHLERAARARRCGCRR